MESKLLRHESFAEIREVKRKRGAALLVGIISALVVLFCVPSLVTNGTAAGTGILIIADLASLASICASSYGINTMLRPPKLFCPGCDKFISGEFGWICGYCDTTNNNSRNAPPFLRACKTCKREPKAYVCPHCEQLNFLDGDEDGKHPAKVPGMEKPKTPAKDPSIERERKHRE